MIEHMEGPFTICRPEHCGRCDKGDDAGIIGNAFTCAIDGVARFQWETCAHPAEFVEITRRLEERYPNYDDDFWGKTRRRLGYVDKLARGEATAIDFGKGMVGIVSALPSMMAGPVGDEYRPVKDQYTNGEPAKVAAFVDRTPDNAA
jgi:hypothetical protein